MPGAQTKTVSWAWSQRTTLLLPRQVQHRNPSCLRLGTPSQCDHKLAQLLTSAAAVLGYKRMQVVEALLGVQWSGRGFRNSPLVAGSRNTLAIDADGGVSDGLLQSGT